MFILIIDDDKEDVQLMSEILVKEDSDIVVQHAFTGYEGLNILESCQFDAIIVDYILPDCNGLELVKKIREKIATPIVFVTGSGDEMVAVQAIQNGCQNYFPKNNLTVNGSLFHKVVSAPSNLQYLEVITKLHLLKQQARNIEKKMMVVGCSLSQDSIDKLQPLMGNAAIV